MFSECDFLKFDDKAPTAKDFDKIMEVASVVFSSDNFSSEEKKDLYMKISLMYEMYK
ncbi:hypothetical protein PN398_01225 [Romboutsia sp. 1001216sp1]|uniref:hypothetical protein n=1 Tax=Romboutsia TaxID=1501226 RepID=UPI00159EC2C2|nr:MULTISPECIES: hypothetical protein [Romboutsia]MDB8789332.1 hypothetical protein [Romboutsia sp. 1001216sp1]